MARTLHQRPPLSRTSRRLERELHADLNERGCRTQLGTTAWGIQARFAAATGEIDAQAAARNSAAARADRTLAELLNEDPFERKASDAVDRHRCTESPFENVYIELDIGHFAF